MADSPALALQAALVARLAADTDLAALVSGRIYDEPPQGVTFPYVRLGNMVVEPFRTDDRAAWRLTVRIDAYSRPVAGRVQATQIAEAVIASLDEQAVTVTGFRHAWTLFETSTVSREGDGKTYVAAMVFQTVLDVLP